MQHNFITTKRGFNRFFKILGAGALIIVIVFAAVWFPSRVKAAEVTIDPADNVATPTAKLNNSSDTVFISDQVGYAFYRGGSQGVPLTAGRCVYSKTTNGGSTWSTPAFVQDRGNTGCVRTAVWYDRWTPGDTTGTLIHIATLDTSTDDIYYNSLDTSTDTLTLSYSTPMNVSTNMSNSFTSPANRISITKATDNTIYIGVTDADAGDQTWVKKCASACATTQSNWVNTSFVGLQESSKDEMLLMPLPSGNILAIGDLTASDNIVSKVYTSSSSAWDTSYAVIDGNSPENSIYGGHLGATLNKNTNDIYLAYVANNDTLGGGNDSIRTAKYTSGSWTNTGDVITNDASRGLTNAKLALDENTGNIYAIYSAQTTAGTSSTTNIYSKLSTNAMTSWGTESSALNTAGTQDIYGARVNIMSNERIYVTWHDQNDGINGHENGNTVVDLTPVSNSTPAAPTLSSPANTATNASTTPQFQLKTTDADSDYLRYKIQVCSASNCSSVIRTIDQTASQTGWSGQNQQSNTAYTGSSTLVSSTMAVHTYQAPALSAGTQYWWRAYAIDPGGTNTFSSASTIWSFTTAAVNTAPNAPTLMAPANASTGQNTAPQFQFSSTDAESDFLQYKMEICTTNNCSSVAYTVNQTTSQTGWSGQDSNGGMAYASGTTATYNFSLAPLSGATQYWWRAYAIDPSGTNTYSAASSIRSFTTAASAGGVVIKGGTVVAGGTKIEN